MKFLRIRGGAKRKRADGSAYKTATIVEKNHKYGDPISEANISVKRPILVTGAHETGKSRFLNRLYENERELYGAKIKHPALWFSAQQPISSWVKIKSLQKWYDTQNKTHTPKKLWAALEPCEREQQLAHYITETKALVFIDDVHRLTERKLQIAQECLLAAKLYVISSTDEQHIPANLREIVKQQEAQRFELNDFLDDE